MLSKRTQQLCAMAWMFIFPHISHVKTLMSEVTALGKRWHQEGLLLWMELCSYKKKKKKLPGVGFIPPCEIPQESIFSAEEKDPSPNLDSIITLVLDFWASRTVSNKLSPSKFLQDNRVNENAMLTEKDKQHPEACSHPALQGAYF